MYKYFNLVPDVPYFLHTSDQEICQFKFLSKMSYYIRGSSNHDQRCHGFSFHMAALAWSDFLPLGEARIPRNNSIFCFRLSRQTDKVYPVAVKSAMCPARVGVEEAFNAGSAGSAYTVTNSCYFAIK